ncbi:MAG: 5-(carboxyamino)imidazole ribonucleotide synthase [Bacteroidia bacterium]|nr:5-(carboxyamino)imidazole ribonucleotide synthase [Bacteroidia bacterium]
MTQPFKHQIGIIGGGQLGKMLIESGLPLNVEYNILEASTDCPSARYAKTFIQGSLMDDNKIKELAAISDVITYEIEHVNVQTLIELEQMGKTVIPSASILSIIQDKGKQKQFYAQHGLATSSFEVLNVDAARSANLDSYPGEKIVVKSCKGGYDGKGVAILTKEAVQNGDAESIFQGEVVLEAFVEDAIELAVIVARNAQGEIRSYPVVEMVFDPEINLVDYLFAPSKMPETVQNKATELALNAISAMDGVGIFAVELFVNKAGQCLINEIAPRPHNSGHHTIEACYTSQYEQLNRIMLGLPLGETDLVSPAVMTNILGSKDLTGDYRLDGLNALMSTQGAYLHWYNKTSSKPGRKMGHFTVLDESLESAVAKSQNLRDQLKTVKPD